MNKFLKNFDWSFKSIAKVTGILIAGLVALSIVIALISFSFRTITGGRSLSSVPGVNQLTRAIKAASPSIAYDSYGGADGNIAMEESVGYGEGGIITPYPPQPGSTGDDAEEYEVKSYNGSIRTHRLENTCLKIENLKGRKDVIFENSNRNKDNCYYTFKVTKETSEEIADFIRSLKPESFNANVQTIKGSIEYYDNELEIQKKKLASIEETLEQAQDAYDDIQALATRQQDAETLATIINNKLNLIERLTNERLNTKSRIDRYNQNRGDQLDRLNYTFFNVNVYKDLIFDWKQIKDDWRMEARNLVTNINNILQAITLQLIGYLIRLVQALAYLLIAVAFVKILWKGTKMVWAGNYKFIKLRKGKK